MRWLESHTHEQLRAWLQKAGEELGIRLLPPDDEPRKGDMG